MYNEEIIKKAQKYYKKYINIIELSLINYEGLNYYIRLDQDKKKNRFYLRSINLNIVDKFEKDLVNQELLVPNTVDIIINILRNSKASNYEDIQSKDTDLVCFKATYCNIEYKYTFNLFIPSLMPFIADVFYFIFANLPKRLDTIYNELTASLTNNEIRYTYKKPFKFDLFKGDLTKVFGDVVISKGLKYYKENRVRFIERINNSYYATIEGNNNNLYTVIIDYDEKNKTIRTGCNCPCEFHCKHMYATILAIRDKQVFKYYKVRYIDENTETMYDKLFTLNYFLCIGVDKDKLILVYPDGVIQSVFIKDKFGNNMFEVVEDDEDHTLTEYIKNL